MEGAWYISVGQQSPGQLGDDHLMATLSLMEGDPEAALHFLIQHWGWSLKSKGGNTALLWMEESLRLSCSGPWEETRCHVLKDPSATITPCCSSHGQHLWQHLWKGEQMLGRSVDGGRVFSNNFEYAEFLPYMLTLASNSHVRCLHLIAPAPGVGLGNKCLLHKWMNPQTLELGGSLRIFWSNPHFMER